MDKKTKGLLIDPLFNNNPIALQVLGICSALAVTTQAGDGARDERSASPS
jgi:Na+-transporting NADH:ubiquinone oxidoreductase subunit D